MGWVANGSPEEGLGGRGGWGAMGLFWAFVIRLELFFLAAVPALALASVAPPLAP